MEIYINARFLTQKITGVQRFAIEISKQLKILLPDIKFISPQNIIQNDLAEYFNVETCGKFSSHIWEQIELPIYLKNKKCPLLINFGNTAPLAYKNQIVSILDLSFIINPKWFSRSFSLFYSFLIPRIAKQSIRIITISENSKKDIIEKIGINENRIDVLYCDVPMEFKKINNNKTDNKYGEYILAVSSLDPRKNFARLIEAFNKLSLTNLRLVIVGSANKVFSDAKIKKLIKDNQFITFTGYVDQEELIGLYKNAKSFIYPSLYEGFGIPPLEAMASGCPTIVSNVASLPEVCGDASYYVDPYNLEDIGKGIEEMINNEILRDQLMAKGFERIKLFNWEFSARKLYTIIRNIK
jgi:glycosyltransferase involved in cell wall biosynthesis